MIARMQNQQRMRFTKSKKIIEMTGVISYKILLRIAEQANIQDAIAALKQNLEEEESMSDWITANASSMIDQLWPKIVSSLNK
jgi:ferritin-like metal-binding protein YciE